MPQCNVCMADIDDQQDTHVRVVKPMEYKGETQQVRNYYCSIACLVEHARD